MNLRLLVDGLVYDTAVAISGNVTLGTPPTLNANETHNVVVDSTGAGDVAVTYRTNCPGANPPAPTPGPAPVPTPTPAPSPGQIDAPQNVTLFDNQDGTVVLRWDAGPTGFDVSAKLVGGFEGGRVLSSLDGAAHVDTELRAATLGETTVCHTVVFATPAGDQTSPVNGTCWALNPSPLDIDPFTDRRSVGVCTEAVLVAVGFEDCVIHNFEEVQLLRSVNVDLDLDNLPKVFRKTLSAIFQVAISSGAVDSTVRSNTAVLGDWEGPFECTERFLQQEKACLTNVVFETEQVWIHHDQIARLVPGDTVGRGFARPPATGLETQLAHASLCSRLSQGDIGPKFSEWCAEADVEVDIDISCLAGWKGSVLTLHLPEDSIRSSLHVAVQSDTASPTQLDFVEVGRGETVEHLIPPHQMAQLPITPRVSTVRVGWPSGTGYEQVWESFDWGDCVGATVCSDLETASSLLSDVDDGEFALGQASARSALSPSGILRQNLESTGQFAVDVTDAGSADAHHIVPYGSMQYMMPRCILRELFKDPAQGDVDPALNPLTDPVNQAFNGIFLPEDCRALNKLDRAIHSKTHTSKYRKLVNDLFRDGLSGSDPVSNQAEALAVLEYLHSALSNPGTFSASTANVSIVPETFVYSSPCAPVVSDPALVLSDGAVTINFESLTDTPLATEFTIEWSDGNGLRQTDIEASPNAVGKTLPAADVATFADRVCARIRSTKHSYPALRNASKWNPEAGTHCIDISAAPESSSDIVVAVSCREGNGRIDVAIANQGVGDGTYRMELTDRTPRATRLAPGGWWLQAVTGRPDKDYNLSVTRNGVNVHSTVLTVACDVEEPSVSRPEAQVLSACHASQGDGYIIFMVVNPTDQSRGYVVEFEGLANRSTTAGPHEFRRVSAITGRQNGTYQARVRTTAGVTIADFEVVVDC